jgi:hypothetical protein
MQSVIKKPNPMPYVIRSTDGSVSAPEAPLNQKGRRMGLKFKRHNDGCLSITIRHKQSDSKMKAVGWAWMSKAQVAELVAMLQT